MKVCRKCGARVIVERRYSERLRRYYSVEKCAACGEGDGA